ncbi:MAG: phospholipase D family protein [Candidatus Odinarchaeota archaeon]
MMFLSNGQIHKKLIQLIDSSKEAIRIVSPWVSPTWEVTDALRKAKARGVRVTVITRPESESNQASKIKSNHYDGIVKLASIGCEFITKEIYDEMLHDKFYLFDEEGVIITSANLTKSSLVRNSEVGIFTADSTVIKECKNKFEELKTLVIGIIRNGERDTEPRIIRSDGHGKKSESGIIRSD